MTDLSVVNTLARGIGDNLPPLDELLREEIAPQIERDDQLIDSARSSRIACLDDAERVTTLVALIRDQERILARAHEERKAPFLRDGRLVDRTWKPEIERLLAVRTALERMLTQWQVARQNEARRERERLEAEQRRREEEAEQARQAAEAAKAAGTGGAIAAELDAIRAQEEADRLARQAETIRPERIQTAAGAVAMRREIAFAITDERKAIAWLLKTQRHALLQASRTILGSVLRGMGVDGAQHADIPGVEVTIEHKASVR